MLFTDRVWCQLFNSLSLTQNDTIRNVMWKTPFSIQVKNVSFQSPEVLSNRTIHVLSWKWNSGINGLTHDDDDTVDISVEIQTGAMQLKPATHVTFSGCGFLTFDPLEPKSQPRGLPREIVLRVLCDIHAKDTGLYEKSAQRRRKHCALAVVRRSRKKIRPAADPIPGGAGRPKFNQLEMVTTFTHKHNLVKIDTRNFELSW